MILKILRMQFLSPLTEGLIQEAHIMRVLILTYPRIGLNRGGLQIQIDQTIKGLNQLGVETILYDPWQNQLPQVDICHAFSIDASMIYHIERAANLRKPVVVSSVLNLFKTPIFSAKIKTALADFVPGFYSDLKRAKKILMAAERIIALNDNEQRLLISIFGISPNICKVVPNGIDTRFSGGDTRLFENKYGFRDFLLEVASIENRKNQLNSQTLGILNREYQTGDSHYGIPNPGMIIIDTP